MIISILFYSPSEYGTAPYKDMGTKVFYILCTDILSGDVPPLLCCYKLYSLDGFLVGWAREMVVPL